MEFYILFQSALCYAKKIKKEKNMRTIKKILSSMLALAMLVGVFAPYTAFAEDALTSKEANAVTKTVTLHKLVMTKEELAAWDSDKVEKGGYDGTQDLKGLNAIQKSVFSRSGDIKEVAKVFFAIKFAGDYGKTPEEIAKRGRYVKALDSDKLSPSNGLEATDNIEEAMGGLTTESGIKFNTSLLKGNFEIFEIREKSTYVGENGETLANSKAVPVKITLPLVNNNGTVLDAHVYPKNTEDKPLIDKNFAKQLESENPDFYKNFTEEMKKSIGADYSKYDKEKLTVSQTVGTKIPYEVKTKVNANTEYAKLVWKDSMTNGLTFNNDLKIVTDNGIDLALNTDYKITSDSRGFVLSLTQEGLKKVKDITKPAVGTGKDVEFTLTYSATLNGTAIVDNPEKNDIYLEYGNKPDKEVEENPVTPSNGELSVTKNWSDNNAPQGVSATYSLKKDNQNMASVTLDSTITSGTFDLGNGIKFVVSGAFSGRFIGLGGDTNGWTISERVAGYSPEYSKINADGTVTITNKKDTDNPPPLNPTEPKVLTGGKKFVKTDNSESPVRLAGAKFVVKNENGKYLASKSDKEITLEQTALEKAKTELDDAVKAYNNRTDDSSLEQLKQTVTDKQSAYNEAVRKASIKYEWVSDATDKNTIILVSNKDGQFEVNGLSYGHYKLEEIEAPKGFAKIEDIEFLVSTKGENSVMDINYKLDDGSNNAQKVVNKKVTIPQTGGIGTIIFTVAGLALMLGAAYAIKKNREEA